MNKNVPLEPAFPRPLGSVPNRGEYNEAQKGMSLRDYFAAHALTACVLAYQNSPKVYDGQLNMQTLADMAYSTADAMLERRRK